MFAREDMKKAWGVFGVHFSPQTWRALESFEEVELFRCGACGFRFSHPALAGNGLFYAELEQQKTTYYPPEVPEFTRTLAWARERGAKRLLDVGCGEGAFLDLARRAGLEVMGVELNTQAAEVCRRKGHNVQSRDLAEMVAEKDGLRFDLVTIFQVLEHVPDPVSFLTQAAQLTVPGGCVSVAVPNESGIYRICPKEPHQWPPHHITRWRLRDLRALGRVCQLEVLEAGTNRLLGSEGEHFWRVRNQIAAALSEPPLPGGKTLPAVLSFVYRKLGMRYWLPAIGTSVYALYQRR